ncbi:MAG: acetate--CoA ligase [Thermodesulfobacteriota bacterium]|nr:acetate--CoA ligase [Thermodesulfobacteriota bacterium]
MNEKIKMQIIPPHVDRFIKWGEEDFESFWEEVAVKAQDEIYWFRKWDKAFSWDEDIFKWYAGGITNICYNCVDYNIEKGRAGRAALIAESGEADEIKVVTYGQLLAMVMECASALRGIGVKKGDRVAIYIPTCIESVVAMLACARIGAIHVVIFAGFSGKAVADRLKLTGAKYILTQDEGSRRGKTIPLKKIIDQSLNIYPTDIKKVVVLRENKNKETTLMKGRDIYWEDFLEMGRGYSSAVEKMESNEPLFLLPTSGTTATPKVTVHNHGGYQIYIHSMGQWIYKLRESDVWFCTSDIGWIVGHSYNVYGPLLSGCTSILYNGTPDYPRRDMWWDIIERNKVTGLWVSPTGVRGLMKLGIDEARKHDLSSVERVFSAGEVLNPPAWQWLYEEVFGNKIPVIDHMWQTESAGPLIANPYGLSLLPIKPGSVAISVPGIKVDIVNEKSGHSMPAGEKGILIVKEPFPGLSPTLWEEHKRYLKEYWEKIPSTKSYYSGDAAYKDDDGYIWFVGRSDEVIKIAAHRVGTIEIENALMSHPAVVESGVSGVPDELKGQVACAFVVLKSGFEPLEELKKELLLHVRENMGPFVVIRGIEFVNMLPKTRSGKIMRRVMKAIWTKKDMGDLSTIEEEASVNEIIDAIKRMQECN